jgi:hypothetical protein
LDKLNKYLKWEYIAFIAILLVFSYGLFGFTGIKFLLGFIFIFFVPYYLILDKLDISKEEKIIFAFIIGIGTTVIVVYYIAFLLGSLKTSILISTIIIYALALVFKFRKYKKAAE